jgi:hypothetical protein
MYNSQISFFHNILNSALNWSFLYSNTFVGKIRPYLLFDTNFPEYYPNIDVHEVEK